MKTGTHQRTTARHFNTPITKDITLYAKWAVNAVTHTVSFDTKGGTPANIDSQVIGYGNKATKPANPTKEESVTEAYIFENWYTSEDEGVTLSEEPFDFDTAITSDLKLYAKYGYKITYKNTKDVANSNAEVYTGEKAITLANLEKAGYIFDGWFDAETNGNKITSITKGSTGAKTFWAHWTLGTKDAPDAVGDIVLNNGRAIAYEDGLVFDDEVKASAIALIFYKGTELNSGNDTTTSRTLGVGLKHSSDEIQWQGYNGNLNNGEVTTIYCKRSGKEPYYTFIHETYNDRNGIGNLEEISAWLVANNREDTTTTAENFPAFYFAKNYSNVSGSNVKNTDFESGWYLPSIAELSKLYVNGESEAKIFNINEAIETLGGDKFETTKTYWSASQSEGWFIWVLKFANGEATVSEIPENSNYCCCIREF